MAKIGQDEVIEILKIISESSFDELHLEMEDFKLILKKYGDGRSVQEVEHVPTELREKEPVDEPRALPAEDEEPEAEIISESDMQKAGAIVGVEKEGYLPIKAPMLGTFYKAPKPGAPPFVEVGQLVGKDDTVCIIEVMKLFNTVKAGVRGRIAEILVEDAEMVEYQQTLFLVEEIEEAETGDEEAKRA
jgi:acetyl-CoA carboxylase biotin carboxyl carrier protein